MPSRRSSVTRAAARVTLVAALLAACTTGSPARQAAPSSTPTLTSSPPEPYRDLVVAVVGGARQLDLYTVGRDRQATLLRRLVVPGGTRFITDVSLSAEADPRVCALFFGPEGGDSPGPSALGCYDRGRSSPVILFGSTDENATAEPYATVSASLRPDGRALAWLDGDHHEQYDVVMADWDGAATGHERRFVTDPARPRGRGEASRTRHRITGVTWCGADALLLDTYLDGGDSTLRLLRLDADAERRGWLPSAQEVVPRGGASHYLLAAPCQDEGAALALEWAVPHGSGTARRAVRLDPRSGALLEVISVPAKARDLGGVSGGERGIVYTTHVVGSDSEGGSRYYVRFPGEQRGLPIRGLPTDATDVVAQP